MALSRRTNATYAATRASLASSASHVIAYTLKAPVPGVHRGFVALERPRPRRLSRSSVFRRRQASEFGEGVEGHLLKDVADDPSMAHRHDAAAHAATSRSCVTRSTVMPRSRLSFCKRARTSRLVRVSRLPVGSSARRSGGSVTSARAIATRCCWPPESWFGLWSTKWAADDVYKAANATAKTTASKLASVVTWATPDPITYGTALSATQLDATASVPGMFVYTPASGKVLAVGTQTLSVKFTPTQSTDYTTVTGTTVPLVVNPANTTTTITTTSVNPSIIGHAVTVYYAVASPGKVTGSVAVTASSGETCGGPVAEATGLGSCRLTLQTVGSITLTATYGGDANNNGSVSAGFTQTVN